jgi:hypothetical protein
MNSPTPAVMIQVIKAAIDIERSSSGDAVLYQILN